MSTQPAEQLPTRQVAELLDEMGILLAWKTLLATHAAHSYDMERSALLLADEDYAGVRILDTDLLAGRTVGQVSVLYEFSLAHTDRDARKASGQYFTPDDVALFLASLTKLFPEGVWLDPCSGVGNLSSAVVAGQEDPEKFLTERLFLLDKDPLALMIARALLFLHYYHGNPELLSILKQRSLIGDYLSGEPLPEHDFVIMNPPYAQVKEDTRFRTGKTRDLYAYFMEQATREAKGFISITPQSFTHGSKFRELRSLLLEYSSLRLYCFDNIPDSIFRGVKFGSTNTNTANSVRACVTVARNSKKERLITPLLRWRSAQRARMFKTVNKKLSAANLTRDMFPKSFAELRPLEEIVSGPEYVSLTEVTVPEPTEHSLTFPATPRYFLPAVQRPLNRSSFHTVYFPDRETKDAYYPYLNSSILYWWWRLRDGGMSLSAATLGTLPVPLKPKQAKRLAAKLLASEQENLVVKLNAGQQVENIKHDPALIQALNRHFFGEQYAEALARTHESSYF